MTQFFQVFTTALIALLSLDAVWLGLVAKNWYAQTLGSLMRSSPNWLAAGGFYILYCFGLTYLILLPAIHQEQQPSQLVFRAFVFGVVAYATYDLTNLAVLRNWPVGLSFVDILWGGVMTAAVCWIVFRVWGA